MFLFCNSLLSPCAYTHCAPVTSGTVGQVCTVKGFTRLLISQEHIFVYKKHFVMSVTYVQ